MAVRSERSTLSEVSASGGSSANCTHDASTPAQPSNRSNPGMTIAYWFLVLSEFLQPYSRAFRTVEIDSTFYRIQTSSMVAGWRNRSPAGFVFAAKIPRVITHQKLLKDSEAELLRFLRVMEPLGDKLGPLLFQFPYFNKNIFASREQFDKVLRPFLASLPKGFRFAIEIRNKNWIS